jgi:hypothetical protein
VSAAAALVLAATLAAQATPALDPAPASPPPAAVEAAPAPAAPSLLAPDEWLRRYDQARASMYAGRFAAAAAAFAALAAATADAGDQTLAREQADICRRWAQAGFVLVPPGGLPAARPERPELPADRRTTDELAVLYTDAVLYGLGTGIALAAWTEPSSAAGGILPALGLGGLAAGAVYMLDHPMNLRYGVAQSIASGMWLGFEDGLAWTLWNQARVAGPDEWSARTVATVLWGASTAGAVAGGVLGTRFGTTPGRASLAGSAGLWAALVAGLVAASASSDSPRATQSFTLAGALALNAGAVAGIYLGQQVSPSIARVRFVDLGGLAGGILTGGIFFAVTNGHASEAAATGVLAAGITGGLAAAWVLTADFEPSLPAAARAPDRLSALTPSIAPAASGTGVVLGLGGAL